MKKSYRALLALVLFVSFGTFAFADVTATLKATKVVVRDGKEVREDAAKAKPGDVVEYTLVVKNNDKVAHNNVKGDLPIPQGTEYIGETAAPQPTAASANGTTFSAYPLKKTVETNGKRIEEVLPFSAYKILRWNIGTLAPGASNEMRARVRIKTTTGGKQ